MSFFGIQNPDVTFPNDAVIGGVIPAPVGLLSMAFLGGTLAESITNIANSDAPLTVVGSPTLQSAYATTNPANCFDTGLGAGITGDFTYAVVANLPLTTGAGQFIGNLKSGVNNGDGIAQVVTGDYVKAYFGYGVNAQVSVAGLDHARFRLIIARLSGTQGTVRVYDDAATPAPRSASISVPTRNPGGRSVRFGASQELSSLFGGTVNVAFASVWSRSITDVEVDNELRSFLAETIAPSLNAAI